MLTSSCRGLLCESFLSRATIQEKFTRSLLHETITRRFNSTDKPLTSRWPEDKKKGHLEPKKSSRRCKLTVSVTQKLFVAHTRLSLGKRHCLETSRTRSVPGHVTEAVIFAWNSNNIQSSSISAVVSFLVENSPLNPRVGARHDIKNPDVQVMSEIKLDCQESTVSCVLIGEFCLLRDSLRDRLLHVWFLKIQDIEMIN